MTSYAVSDLRFLDSATEDNVSFDSSLVMHSIVTGFFPRTPSRFGRMTDALCTPLIPEEREREKNNNKKIIIAQ